MRKFLSILLFLFLVYLLFCIGGSIVSKKPLSETIASYANSIGLTFPFKFVKQLLLSEPSYSDSEIDYLIRNKTFEDCLFIVETSYIYIFNYRHLYGFRPKGYTQTTYSGHQLYGWTSKRFTRSEDVDWMNVLYLPDKIPIYADIEDIGSKKNRAFIKWYNFGYICLHPVNEDYNYAHEIILKNGKTAFIWNKEFSKRFDGTFYGEEDEQGNHTKNYHLNLDGFLCTQKGLKDLLLERKVGRPIKKIRAWLYEIETHF